MTDDHVAKMLAIQAEYERAEREDDEFREENLRPAPSMSVEVTTTCWRSECRAGCAYSDLCRARPTPPAEPAPEPRFYTVGLPVVVTVYPGGHVTYSIDLSEAAEAIREDEGAADDRGYTDEQVAVDEAAITEDLHRYGTEPTVRGRR